MSKNNFIDESYLTLKHFTKNANFSAEEEKDLNSFVKQLELQIANIEKINSNLIVNLGKAFNYLIEEGVDKDDNKRNS